jgi:hypothetical protein
VACLGAVNRRKSESGVSVGRAMTQLEIAANPATASRIRTVLGDVLGAVRAPDASIVEDDVLENDTFEVRAAEWGGL